MNSKLSWLSRTLVFVAGILLMAVLFVPIWQISLQAPQYPEGLMLEIHANGLKGNVEIVNGLNHYIGMRPLRNEDFPEFKILPACIVFFSLLMIIAAFLNRRKWLYSVFGLFVAFGIVSMIDFWKWEYDYGHHLNPDAPIVVPGMAYQPPLIGFKQLLNFGAWSVPGIGGWIFIASGLLLAAALFLEIRSSRKTKASSALPAMIILILMTAIGPGCSNKPTPIITGRDECSFCRMTISDRRFGAELVTRKGKPYKFDDLHCLQQFIKAQPATAENAALYVTSYSGNQDLVDIEKAFYLRSDAINAPMGGHIAGFSSKEGADSLHRSLNGTIIGWKEAIGE